MHSSGDGPEDGCGNNPFHHWLLILHWLGSEQTPDVFRRGRLTLKPFLCNAAALKEGDDFSPLVRRKQCEVMALASFSVRKLHGARSLIIAIGMCGFR